MVHAAPDGSELVIGVFLSADATVRDNVFLEQFWSNSAFDNRTRPVPAGKPNADFRPRQIVWKRS